MKHIAPCHKCCHKTYSTLVGCTELTEKQWKNRDRNCPVVKEMKRREDKIKTKIWSRISDDNVQAVWICTDPKCVYHNFKQIFDQLYAITRMPTCGKCNKNLTYSHTEIVE